MELGIPQGLFAAWMLFELAWAIAKHGEQKTIANHNAGLTAITLGLLTGLVWWGGFFS